MLYFNLIPKCETHKIQIIVCMSNLTSFDEYVWNTFLWREEEYNEMLLPTYLGKKNTCIAIRNFTSSSFNTRQPIRVNMQMSK